MIHKVLLLVCASGVLALETAVRGNDTNKICQELDKNYTNTIRGQVKDLVKLEIADAINTNSSQLFEQNIRSHFMDMVSNVTHCYNITDNTAHINIANIKLELLKNALEAKKIKDLFKHNNGLSCIRQTAKAVYNNAVIIVVGSVTNNSIKDTIINVNPLEINKEKCKRNSLIMKRVQNIMANNSLCSATASYVMAIDKLLNVHCNGSIILETPQTQTEGSNTPTTVIVIVVLIIIILVSFAGIIMLKRGMCRKTKRMRVAGRQSGDPNGIPLN